MRSLNVNRGGVTKAVLKKANMLSQKYKSVIVVTTLFQQKHKEIIENLRTSGELSPEVQVYNFYDDIRQKKPKFLLKKPFNNAEEKGFIKFKVNNHPHDSYRYYKDGYYRMYKRFINGKLQFIDYMDNSGKRVRREEYDEAGYLVRERLMDMKNNKPSYERYFDYKGNCILGVHINSKKGSEGVVVDFTEEKSYEELYEIQIKWLNEKLERFSSPVIFTEFRGNLDKITEGLSHKNIKKVSVIHSSHLENPYNDIYKIRAGFRDVLKDNNYDQYIFLTEAQKQDVEKVFGKKEKYSVISHSYNTNEQKKDYDDVKRNSKLAIMIARYEEDKRIDEAITAFRLVVNSVPDSKLFIYGKGPLEGELNTLIKELKLEKNVFLKGYTNNTTKAYRSAACTLITSRREGFGLIMIESMSQGTPVIAYNFKYGPAEVIFDGENGFLIENGNQESLANKIIKIMTNDDVFIKLSNKAIKAKETFNDEKQLEAWINVIEN